MKVKDCVLHTNGKGLWSDVKAEVLTAYENPTKSKEIG